MKPSSWILVPALLLALTARPALGQNCIEIQCPSNLVVECQSPGGAFVNFSATATNHCSTNLVLVCVPSTGSLFPLGVTTVRCVATNSTASSNACTFTITVRDTTPPQVFCPRLIQTQCESPAGARVQFTVIASDACDTNVAAQCDPPSGYLFPPGTNTVNCPATDDAGNVGRCIFPVIVRGQCAPDPCLSIVCPSNIVVACNAPGGAIVHFSPQATNTCDRAFTVTCAPPSGSLFAAGLTTVLCTAQGETNAVRCAFLVEVQDTTPPTFNCPSNRVVAAQAVDGAVVQWTASASDDCDTNVSVHCDPPSGSLFALGTAVVRCFAIDDSGNEALCAFRVTVRDERPLAVNYQAPSNVLIRWHVPGALEVATGLLPVPDWQPVTGGVISNGDERRLVYPLSGDVRFFRLVAPPFTPPPDEDRDGVPDAIDRCPGTPSGALVDARGCSLIQLAMFPEQTARRSLEMLDEIRGHWREYPRLQPAVVQVEAELAQMNLALGLVREGRITDTQEPLGLERFSQALDGLRTVRDDLLTLIAVMRRDLLAHPPNTQGYGDTTPRDAELMTLQIQARRFQRAIAEAESAEDALLELKRSRTGQGTLRGKVAAINDAERWIMLTDGKRIGLAERQFNGHLTLGAEVEVDVQTFGDGTALAFSIEVLNTGVPFQFVPEIRCLFMRVVPVQPLPPYFPTTPSLHYPSAYEHNGILLLERGMRLAAASGNCPAILVPPGTVLITRMKLDLQYKPIGGNYKTVTLATSLDSNSEPVPLPWDMSSSAAVLTATVFRQQCPAGGLPGSCSDPEELSVDSYNLHVRSRYDYAEAVYVTNVFDLEDSPQEESYRVTKVAEIDLAGALSGLGQFTFKAEGFSIAGNELDFDFISLNESFAVHEWDLYDTPGVFFKEQTFGVTNRSALYWPRITGSHNGRSFRYACALPQLTRDAVAFCGTQPHTLYRLPFKGGWPVWSIGQGNFGSFTHTDWQSYAFDFGAASGTQVRAARGGVVDDVLESWISNNWDPTEEKCTNFNANYLAIRHQDGTIGNYVHMPQNGVQVAIGQKIRRGDAIAIVGNTGCATGSHLHFDVRDPSGNNTILSRFEAWDVCVPELGIFLPCFPLQECYVPATGQILFSTQ